MSTDTPDRPATVIVVDDAPAPDGAPIDPRFRARRIAVKRQAGRKRLRWFFVLAALAVVVAAVVGFVRSPVLAARNVEVTGAVYSDAAAVAELVASLQDEPLLTIDTSAIADRFEALPWVKRAEVRRDLPSTLRVDLLERRPAATFYAPDGRYRVIDREGRVLVALDGQPIDFVPIAGVGPDVAPGDVAPAPYVGAAEVAASMPDELRPNISDIVLDPDGALRMRLIQGGQVLFGPPTDVRAKLLATLTVLADLGDPAKVAVLDVRVPGKPVLTSTTPAVDPAAAPPANGGTGA